MTVSKEEIIAAIANMNELTKQQSINWQPSKPIRLGSSHGVGYQTNYQGSILRVTQYSPPRVQGYYADISSPHRHHSGNAPEPEFVLEIVDDQGVPIREFPKVEGITDLFASAQAQSADGARAQSVAAAAARTVDLEGLIKSLLAAR